MVKNRNEISVLLWHHTKKMEDALARAFLVHYQWLNTFLCPWKANWNVLKSLSNILDQQKCDRQQQLERVDKSC